MAIQALLGSSQGDLLFIKSVGPSSDKSDMAQGGNVFYIR